MVDPNIHTIIEDDHGTLTISGSLRLLRIYAYDPERAAEALVKLLEARSRPLPAEEAERDDS
jgi:hypothetical protein